MHIVIMSHQETRLAILKSLYSHFYGDQIARPIPTVQLVEETFPNTDPERIFPEINYLEDKGFIHGEHTSGVTYPRWIDIEDYGIDLVEQYEADLRNTHYDRRIRILNWLYKQYFDNNPERQFPIDDINSNVDLTDLPQHEIDQEYFYMERKGLIEGLKTLGPRPILNAKISSYGIDEVEQIADRVLQDVPNLDVDELIRNKITEILQERDSTLKTTKALDILRELPQWIEVGAKIAKSVLVGDIEF